SARRRKRDWRRQTILLQMPASLYGEKTWRFPPADVLFCFLRFLLSLFDRAFCSWPCSCDVVAGGPWRKAATLTETPVGVETKSTLHCNAGSIGQPSGPDSLRSWRFAVLLGKPAVIIEYRLQQHLRAGGALLSGG